MSLYSFNHVHLRSENLDEAVKFYMENFDAEIIWQRTGGEYQTYRLGVMGTAIMISTKAPDENPLPGSTEPKYGLDHFGFEVEDMDKAVAQLKAKGIEFTCEPWEMRPGTRLAFIKAPDNVSIELSWHAEENGG